MSIASENQKKVQAIRNIEHEIGVMINYSLSIERNKGENNDSLYKRKSESAVRLMLALAELNEVDKAGVLGSMGIKTEEAERKAKGQ